MAMQPRNVIRYGSTVTMINNSYGLAQSSNPWMTAEHEILRNIVSYRGPDRVTPRAHHYQKVHKLGLKGFYREWTPGTQNWTEKSGYVGGVFDIPGDALSTDTTAYNAALEKLQSKLRHDADISIDLLQSPQAKKMVRSWVSAAKSLVTTVRKVKKMPLKAASNAYLQYIYGVRPTMSTIFDSMEAFADTASGTYKVWGTGQSEHHEERSITVNAAPALMKINVYHRVKIGCVYTRPTEMLAHISDYTSLNPASIAYELMPWSFVLDWFWDVGGWLRGLESAYVLSPFISRAYVSSGKKADMSVIQDYGSVTPTIGLIRKGRAGTMLTEFTRTPSPSLILPRAPVFPRFAGVKEGVLDHTMQSLALTRSVARSLDKSRVLR